MEKHSPQPSCPSSSTDTKDTDEGIEMTYKIVDQALQLTEQLLIFLVLQEEPLHHNITYHSPPSNCN